MYDLPALVNHVCKETGYEKVNHLIGICSCFDTDSVDSSFIGTATPSLIITCILPPPPPLLGLPKQIALIGHSQGNGLTFMSLSMGMCPSLGQQLSVFIALAPVVYAGPLTTKFPFTTLSRLEWSNWKRIFGVLDFIPLMRWAYDYAPANLFVSDRCLTTLRKSKLMRVQAALG